jgi:mannose-6-phosphate isomerase
MSELYPLKFEPILKEKVWGGNALASRFNKKPKDHQNIGESWEISAMQGSLSVVSNGFLAGNNIEELIEVYMGDITGDSIYEKFGKEFPLLIKFIEAKEDLSIQVHPGNEMAREKHNAYGKTEMWYILESENEGKIYTGFREEVTREDYSKALEDGTLPGLLNAEVASPGDVFFTTAGRIHAIGKGIVLVEIQQTSDITYRIFDWSRHGTRELHTELALEAIDFKAAGKNKFNRELTVNHTENLVACEFFNTNIIWFNNPVSKDYTLIDSFIIYICIEGGFKIKWEGNAEVVTKGETLLLPAMIKEVLLEPLNEARVLEVFVDEDADNEIYDI